MAPGPVVDRKLVVVIVAIKAAVLYCLVKEEARSCVSPHQRLEDFLPILVRGLFDAERVVPGAVRGCSSC